MDKWLNIEKSNLTVFPNPSNSNVTFDLTSLKTNNGILNISDHTGKIIRSFNLDGKDSVTWDGKNKNNQKVKAGTYFFQLISDERLEAGKIIIL